VERVGRYEILGELGRGAAGQVYRAHDPKIGRLVAIKVLAPTPGAGEREAQEWRARFLREAVAAGRLTHPNIVTVYDVGEEAGRPFLVMELVEGEALDARLAARGPLPIDQVVSIGRQVAQGLDYAHRQGVIHRDIKPANILRLLDGAVKVADFGIARLSGAEMTHTGQILGTPSYMAPEQVAGGKVDGRSDLFSLAAVLYELTTGEKAFPGDTISSVLYRIVHEEPLPLRDLNPVVPAGLDVCLRQALSKDPAQRPADGAEFARRLGLALVGTTVMTGSAAAATVRLQAAPTPHPGRAFPWGWLTVGVAIGAIALGAVAWLHSSRAAPTTPAASRPVTAKAVPASLPKTGERNAEAEGERLAAERKRIEAERTRLAREQAELEADRRRMAEEAAIQKRTAEETARREATRPFGSPTPPTLSAPPVRFVGNTVFSSQELNALVEDHLQSARTPDQIRDAIRAAAAQVAQHYHAQGYTAARAIPQPPDVPGGSPSIRIAEGRIGILRAHGLTPAEERLVEDAFLPVLRLGVVQKQAIGEALGELSRRHGLVAKLRVEPGASPETLDLTVEPSGPRRTEADAVRGWPKKGGPFSR
jgi:hypothetical protein